MPANVQSCWRTVGCFLAVVTTTLSDARPQDTSAANIQPPVDLYMLVSIRKPVTTELLIATLESGAVLAKCRYESLDMRTISGAAYGELQAIIRAVEISDEAQSGAKDTRIALRQVPSRELIWEFQLQEKGVLLDALKVQYENGRGEQSEKTYTPAKFEDFQAPLSMTRPGHYALRLEDGLHPLSYSMTLSNLKGEKLSPIVDQKWPLDEQFYLVVMRSFQGSRHDLFEKVRRKKNPEVANPIDVEIGREIQFTFGSIGGVLPTPGTTISRSKFTPQVPWLGEERAVRRVWVLFPLTKENYATYWDKYKNLKGTELPQRIREEHPAWAEGDKAESISLSAESQPRWIELSPHADGRSFSRDIQIQDFDKVAAAFPEVWWLVSWEFDNEMTPPQAIISEPEGGSRGYPIISQAVPLWQRRVQALLSQPTPKLPSKAAAKDNNP